MANGIPAKMPGANLLPPGRILQWGSSETIAKARGQNDGRHAGIHVPKVRGRSARSAARTGEALPSGDAGPERSSIPT